MSAGFLVSLYVCIPLVVSFDYFLPQQVNRVSRWEAYTEHDSHAGPSSHSTPAGRSYSSRTDWSGQQPVARRRVDRRQSSWSRETSFDSSAAGSDTTTYQTDSSDNINPQAIISNQHLYSDRYSEPNNINPPSAYWVQHSSQDYQRGLGERTQFSPRLQDSDFRPRVHLLRNANLYQEQSPQPQVSLFGKESPPLRHTSLGIDYFNGLGVNLPKQKSVKLRTTQESYFGNDNVQEQSILNQRFIGSPLIQSQHIQPNEESLIKQINLLRAVGILPQVDQNSLLGRYQLKGQTNFDTLPLLKIITSTQSTSLVENDPKLKTHDHNIFSAEINANVTLPKVISAPENNKWHEPLNPTVSDDELLRLKVLAAKISQAHATLPKVIATTENPNWYEPSNPTVSDLLHRKIIAEKELQAHVTIPKVISTTENIKLNPTVFDDDLIYRKITAAKESQAHVSIPKVITTTENTKLNPTVFDDALIFRKITAAKESQAHVSIPKFISTTENNKWYEPLSPTVSDDELLHLKVLAAKISQAQATLPKVIAITENPNWYEPSNPTVSDLLQRKIIAEKEFQAHVTIPKVISTTENTKLNPTVFDDDLLYRKSTAAKESQAHVSIPKVISTTENNKWYEPLNPTFPDGDLPHRKATPAKGSYSPISNPSPYSTYVNLHNIQSEGKLVDDLVLNNHYNGENFSPKVQPTVDVALIAPNSPATASFIGTSKEQIQALSNVEEVEGVSVQHPGQWEPCVGPEDLPGLCVPAELCHLEGSYHHYSATQRHYCIVRQKQSIGLCCTNFKKDSVLHHPAIVVDTTAPEVDHSHVHTDDHPFDHDHFLHHEHCIYPIADYKVCGRSGKMMSNITAQATATLHDWPWSAVLVLRSTLGQFCGGTLITRRHVLTAAHCFRTINPDDTLVVLGDYDVRQTNESQSRTFAVERLISNDDYDPATHENDIALLVLNTTTVYNDYIQPACLPVPGPRYTNQTSVLTGWGRVQYRGRLPTELMEVPVPVWDQDMCIPRFAQTIFNTSMCAGAFEGGRDSCQGDSGGSLLKQCHHSHRWVVIGIVSWGIRCAERDKPGVYTRVNEYLDWIHENIADNTTETSDTTVTDSLIPVFINPH